MVQLYKIMTGI